MEWPFCKGCWKGDLQQSGICKGHFAWITSLKTNISPEKRWLEGVFPIEIVSFKGDMLVFWGVDWYFHTSWAFPESSRLPGAFYFIISLGFASDKKWLHKNVPSKKNGSMKIFQPRICKKICPGKEIFLSVIYIYIYWLAHVMILSSLQHPSKKKLTSNDEMTRASW